MPAPVRFVRDGAELLLLGGFGECDDRRFGSTEYAKVVMGDLWGLPPALDMDYEKRVHDAIRALIEAGLVESAHDLSDGGLAVALSECCTTDLGAKVTVPATARPELTLYGEAPSRILISVTDAELALEIATKFTVACPRIGAIMKERLQIGTDNQVLIDLPISGLKQAFETSLPRLLQAQHD
jgi:phosphoribosylformylglycinamidine synthase